MVRIRYYKLTLSLPIILASVSVILSFFNIIEFNRPTSCGALLFYFSIFLQIFLSIVISCPKCGKSPYSIGSFYGPFSLIGKPIPDIKCHNCGYNLDDSLN